MEEEREEPDPNAALSSSLVPYNNATPTLRDQKIPSGKRFPFKLYSMLQDKTVERYVMWTKAEQKDALLIPDLEAFVANVLPKHFKEMKKWGSFQKQLNNYNFQREDRGSGKALYTHSQFRRGHPELLPDVGRRPKCQIPACPGQERRSTPIAPIAGSTTPESGSQTDPPSHCDQVEYDNEGVKLEILQLKRELESSEEGRAAMEVRLQVAESRLHETEQQLLRMEIQILELSKMLEQRSIGDGTLNCVGGPGPAQPVHGVDILHNVAPNIPTAANGGLLTFHTGSLQSDSLESYLAMEMTYGHVDSLSGLDFLNL
ncbi:hypothetical protein M407DRAFT_26638 [Tulasnella calospora MUT 4182]|uniref:HSF-type DNA-binding domain-containing protein n=1 Tax=Tulasnella calospora MUT 4182 TaxID=1051891 RepID=A0A0C3LRB5_9AGAM|nr:hypothetical protein M407DRAFT_26638 [Tulasnella calospora MUT 4182]